MLGRFRTLRDYVLAMLKMEGEPLQEGQDNHKVGDLGIFLAPFGIRPSSIPDSHSGESSTSITYLNWAPTDMSKKVEG